MTPCSRGSLPVSILACTGQVTAGKLGVSVARSPAAVSLVTLGIDGLYWGGSNSLIAIQNGVSPARVLRLTLNGAGDGVTALEVLDRHASASEPTLGVVLRDALLYVANSSWSDYNDEGAPTLGRDP